MTLVADPAPPAIDWPALINDAPLAPTLETVFDDPDDFGRWLASFASDTLVGQCGRATFCPLAEYATARLDMAVGVSAHYGVGPDYACDYLTPIWSWHFAQAIDALDAPGQYGQSVTAAQARDCLAQALWGLA